MRNAVNKKAKVKSHKKIKKSKKNYLQYDLKSYIIIKLA